MRLLECDAFRVNEGMLEIFFDQESVEEHDKLREVHIKNRGGVLYQQKLTSTQKKNCQIQIDLAAIAQMKKGLAYGIFVKASKNTYRVALRAENILRTIADIEHAPDAHRYHLTKNAYIFPTLNAGRSIGLEYNKGTALQMVKSDTFTIPFTEIEDIQVDGKMLRIRLSEEPELPGDTFRLAITQKQEVVWQGEPTDSIRQMEVDLKTFAESIALEEKMRFAVVLERRQGTYVFRSPVKWVDVEYTHKADRYFPACTITDNFTDEEGNIKKLSCAPYIRNDRQLGLLISDRNGILVDWATCEQTSVKTLGKNIHIKAVLDIKYGKPEHLVLKLRGKIKGVLRTIPLTWKYDAKQERYIVRAVIHTNQIQFEQFYWDVYTEAIYEGEQFLTRLRKMTEWTRKRFMNSARQPIKHGEHIIVPFMTKNNLLSIMYRQPYEHDHTRYRLQEHMAFLLYKLFGKFLKRKNIWLVFEKFSESAQDNGYYFFKYCMEQRKADNVYYIIDKKKADYKRLQKYDKNVLQFMSIKHLLYAMGATLLVSSETRAHCYGFRRQNSRIIKILEKKKNVFLQHGVMGLKIVDNVFNKTGMNVADLFVTSSDYEKKIIHDNFGYDEDEIIVTGLCRWDVLEDKSEGKNEILLMPTWRTWLDETSASEFMESDYFQYYSGLLNNERLTQLLSDNDITLNMYIHPKFKDYMGYFSTNHENANIRLVVFGEKPLNKLIMSCKMLVTDYSSVAWDVYYQGKPVVFCQFDLDQYQLYQGSYMDMETELFGDRVFGEDDLISMIQYYIENGFQEKEKYREMRPGYFKYIDHNNSQRIFCEIEERLGIKAISE